MRYIAILFLTSCTFGFIGNEQRQLVQAPVDVNCTNDDQCGPEYVCVKNESYVGVCGRIK